MPVNTTKKVWATGYNNSAFRPLYNSNIASMQVNIPKLGSAFLYQYTYDQLNRIVGMQADTTLNTSTNTWSPLELKDYKERVSYDANGNILNYMRRGKVTAGTNPSGLMDSLNYKYYYTNTSGNRKWYDPGQGIPSDALSLNNKLAHVDDNKGYDSYFTEDIDDQDTANYAYDEIGNLIKDTKEGITGIEWTVYGKIKKITKTGGTTIEYRYDASGNRIWKKAASIETWYVRDASGNVMSIYTYNNSSINSGALSQTETDLYGSSRLGMLKPNINVQSSLAGPAIGTKYITTFTRGNKIFELSNHLGNVLVTVSDKKIPVAKATPNQAQVSYYTADVLSATDYYPFGMSMPRRDTTFSGSYRYKFNGKEVDKDIQGADYDYGFRIYDPRLGRFLSLDPLQKKYPELTPYQFASNTPIQAVDLDGKEAYFVHGTMSNHYRWVDKNNNIREVTRVLFSLTNNQTMITDFAWGSSFINWGNGPFNTSMDRARAAKKLVEHIMATMNGAEPITLIGHSHGANVAIQAVPLLRKALDAKGFFDVTINLITVSAPVDNGFGSRENPATYSTMIHSHIHLYNTVDAVQKSLSTAMENVNYGPLSKTFERRYTNEFTKNYEINVDQYYKHEVYQEHNAGHGEAVTEKSIVIDGTGAHSFDYEHPEAIKKAIDNGTIKKPKI